jgi:Leucine-rich repeat (LRR) protein
MGFFMSVGSSELKMLGFLGNPFLVTEICDRLPVCSIFHLGEVDRGTRELVPTLTLSNTIQIARRALDGIFTLPSLDESKLVERAYCWRHLSWVVKRIDSVKKGSFLREVLESRLIHLEEETQAVKDDNLLKVFESRLPGEVQIKVKGTLSISEKAKIVREFLKNNSEHFFKETELSAISCELTLIPQELIDYFPGLTTLDLWNNQIQVIPDTIGRLVKLEWLILMENQIQVIPDAIGRLGNLRDLGLSNNQISVIPDTIGRLCKLEWLGLEGNPILAPAASAITDGASTSSAPIAGPVDLP